jgi:hypothetical protein
VNCSLLSLLLAACVVSLAFNSPASAAEPQAIFDGKTLGGWRIAKENAYEEPGHVEVKDGVIVLPKGRMSTGVAYAKDFPTMNYEVSLEARRVDGHDFFCGMTFPVDKSHCTLICGGWGGGTTGLSNVDGFAADENNTTGYTEFENGRWYKIRLRVTPEKIAAWIDGEQIVDLDPKDKKFTIWWEQEPLRPFGIGNWYTASELRNIQLTHLKEKITTESTE